MRVILHSKSVIVEDIPGFERELGVERPDADLSAEQAGRLCYLSWSRPNPKTATNPDYLLNIEEEHHYSVIGHPSVTFYIDGISRNCTHEIIRHRWFTFSEVSQRYVNVANFPVVQHPGLPDEFMPVAEAEHESSIEVYNTVVIAMEQKGVPRKEARQAARQVLPGGIETKILMSGNLRAWRDFLAQRLGKGADAEIRAVALEVYKILKVEFPGSFQDFDSQGMITVERLIQRVMDRYDYAEESSNQSRGLHGAKFVEDVRKVLKEGLWVLKDDPWKEDGL